MIRAEATTTTALLKTTANALVETGNTTVVVSKDGDGPAPSNGTAQHVANGIWSVALDSGETNAETVIVIFNNDTTDTMPVHQELHPPLREYDIGRYLSCGGWGLAYTNITVISNGLVLDGTNTLTNSGSLSIRAFDTLYDTDIRLVAVDADGVVTIDGTGEWANNQPRPSLPAGFTSERDILQVSLQVVPGQALAETSVRFEGISTDSGVFDVTITIPPVVPVKEDPDGILTDLDWFIDAETRQYVHHGGGMVAFASQSAPGVSYRMSMGLGL